MSYSKKQQLINYWLKSGIVKNKRVIAAFRQLKREDFVLEEFVDKVYSDTALPIIEGQTISQPTTIVEMLELLELKPGMKVLEVGSGSGYNAALMGKIVGSKGKVYSTEIVPRLVEFARENINKTSLKNIEIILSDGSEGHAKKAPYDRIIVTAAAPRIPELYAKQLKEGGILVIPVGSEFGQTMVKARKVKGKLVKEELGEYIFVPLKGKYGYE